MGKFNGARLVLAGTGLAVILGLPIKTGALPPGPALAPAPRPTIPAGRLHLPALMRVVVTPAPTAIPGPTRLTLNPADVNALKKAVRVVGALVQPAPGTYRLGSNLKLAPDVTLDGRGAVTIVGKTVELFEADGATVRSLTIREAGGDGLRVTHTRWALVEGVTISGSGDGELDIAEGPEAGASIIVRDSRLGPGRKCMLLGDQDQPQDARLVVLLERVTFTDCHVRTPKVHRARVTIRGGTVYHWTGPRLDVQLGGRVAMEGTSWIAGPGSLPGFHLPTGGQVVEGAGNNYRPWKGSQ